MNDSLLEYVELNQSKISDAIINKFDCGNSDMTNYLHTQAKQDGAHSKCITYILIDANKTRIYAYATIATYAMYKNDNTFVKEKENYVDSNTIIATPALEIKMFAIDKCFRGQVAYTLDPIYKRRYSTIFFQYFLEKLYYMSMSIIGFHIIFLRSNTEGYKLYSRNGFLEFSDYLNTYDEKSECCIPMVSTIQNIEDILFSI